MDIQKRILRRPVSTAIWLIVLMLASLILGTGMSIYASANGVPDALDSRMTTIAVQRCEMQKNEDDGTYTFMPSKWMLYEEDFDYLRAMPEVKDVDFRYFSGAYIGDLTARIGLHSRFGAYEDIGWGVGQYLNESYWNVILIGTVEQAFTVPNEGAAFDLSAIGGSPDAGKYTEVATFKVEEAVVLHPDYPLFEIEENDYYDGRVNVEFDVWGSGEETFFQTGKRYAVQGSYDPARIGRPEWPEGTPMIPMLKPNLGDSFFPAFVEDDVLAVYRDIEYREMDFSGQKMKLLSRGERVPTAVEWNGTKEELLSDPFWGQRAREYEAALHCFVVLGTNNLESMYSFVKNEAAIVEGRSFTEEEYAAGAKVLILNEEIAKAAGLSLGDTLSLRQFRAAVGNAEGNTFIGDEDQKTVNNLTLGRDVFCHGMPDGEEETFTIVGLYRLENEWKNALCSFTPNTVFMPRKAQIEEAYGGPSRENGMKTVTGWDADGNESTFQYPNIDSGGTSGVMMSIVLNNGAMDAFQKRIDDDSEYRELESGERFYSKGLGGHELLCFDQGYDAIKDNIGSVIASAGRLAALMAAGAALLFLMYMLLYQGTERKTLGIMRSLGATAKAARRYLFVSGLLLASVGIALGTVLSAVLSKIISAKLYDLTLTQETESLREILTENTVPLWTYAVLAAAAIALAALVLWMQAALIAKKHPRKLMGK